MKKKLLSILLSVTMLIGLLAGITVTAGATNAVITVPLDFTNENTQKTFAIKANGVQWDSATKTLTLDGAVIDCSEYSTKDTTCIALTLPEGSTVKTLADSTVTSGTSTADNSGSYGIYCKDGLKFDGTGKLTATAGAGAYSFGIYSYGSVSVVCGSVSGIGGKASQYSAGVYAVGSITNGTPEGLNGGVELIGKAGQGANSFGIYAQNGSVTNYFGAAMTGTGSKATENHSYGICCNYDSAASASLMNYGTVTGTGAEAAESSVGIVVKGSIENKIGATMTATGGKSNGVNDTDCSAGILCQSTLTNYGTMTATAAEAARYSAGIDAQGDLVNNANAILSAAAGKSAGSGEQDGSCGIQCVGTLTNSGIMSATAGEAAKNSEGIYAKAFLANNANAIMTGIAGKSTGTGEDDGSYGIDSAKTLTNAGTMMGKLADGATAVSNAIGVLAGSDLENSGTITAFSAANAKYADAMAVYGSMTVAESGIVNAYGANGTEESYGLWAYSNISVNGTVNLYGACIGTDSVKQAMYLEPADGNTATLTIGENGKITADGIVKSANANGFGLTVKANNGTISTDKKTVTPTGTDRMTVYGYIPKASELFSDVSDSDYFADAVTWAVTKNITSGTDSTHFAPTDKTTRAQMVTFLYRAAGSPNVTVTDKFTDVSASAYYAKAVAWAVEKGITSGTSETTFEPDTYVNRAQAVTFLYRLAEIDTLEMKDNPFTDVAEGAYYYDAALWASKNGITSGTSETTFEPDTDCARAQVVTFLYRYFVK